MNDVEEGPEFANFLIEDLQKRAGPWPRTAALDEGFGFRVYGYGRSPGRVWIWMTVTLAAAILAGWTGWRYGGAAGQELFDVPNSEFIGQIVFSIVLISGAVIFIRTLAVRFLEHLIEPRFEVILTKEAVEIGGWFGCRRYERGNFITEFAVEAHEDAEAEQRDAMRSGRGASGGRYAQTHQVVLRHMGIRIPITSICRDETGAEALWWRLRNLDKYAKQSGREKN